MEQQDLQIKELVQAFDILRAITNRATSEEEAKQKEHLIRMRRLAQILQSFPPASLHEIDMWLGSQERNEKGWLLCLLTGWEEEKHITCPEAVFNREDYLDPTARGTLRLNRKRLRRKKKSDPKAPKPETSGP